MPGPLTPRHKQRVYLYLSIYLGFHDAPERPQTFSPQQGVHAAYPKKSQSLLAFRVDGMACTAVAPSAVPPELLCLETLEEMQVSETSPKLSEFAYAEGFAQRFNACSSPKEVLAQFSHLPVAVVARAVRRFAESAAARRGPRPSRALLPEPSTGVPAALCAIGRGGQVRTARQRSVYYVYTTHIACTCRSHRLHASGERTSFGAYRVPAPTRCLLCPGGARPGAYRRHAHIYADIHAEELKVMPQ